tara:strand:- start:598 stop:861 length:264 start_codon:yes stop_codon:yes gene_type:complete
MDIVVKIFIEFDAVSEGVDIMSNFDYPCAFIVGGDFYNYTGDEIIVSEEYLIVPSGAMFTIVGYGDENAEYGILYVQSGFCKCNKVN